MAVAVDVAPERRDAVDVAAALRVDQLTAVGSLDDDGCFLHPSLLLRERVPEVLAVRGDEIHGPEITAHAGRRHSDNVPGGAARGGDPMGFRKYRLGSYDEMRAQHR